jgi:hypothetical protein
MAQELTRRFRAFDPSGVIPHTIPNVVRIDTQLLRSNEWPNTILRETLSEEDFAASLINFDVDNVPCAYCSSTPALTPCLAKVDQGMHLHRRSRPPM